MSATAFIIDCKWREILPGDTLKIFHYVGARRKKLFMYKYVEAVEKRPEWPDGLDALRISHLSTTKETFLKIRDGRQWTDCEIIQGYGPKCDQPFEARERRNPSARTPQEPQP